MHTFNLNHLDVYVVLLKNQFTITVKQNKTKQKSIQNNTVFTKIMK